MEKAEFFNDVAIVSVKRNDNRTHFWYMSKDETVHLSRHADLTEESRT